MDHKRLSSPKMEWRYRSVGGCIGAATSTTKRTRGEAHLGPHRHRHHFPHLQSAEVGFLSSSGLCFDYSHLLKPKCSDHNPKGFNANSTFTEIRMILNLHEMFILDLIHECRQSSLGGFPVWSIVLGFVSHVLLVSFLPSLSGFWYPFSLLILSLFLWIPVVVHCSYLALPPTRFFVRW